jgi:DNA modification methylase
MLVNISDIYFPSKLRLRQDYGDLKKFAASFGEFGQFYDVLVRPTEDTEYETEKPWVLMDGGRRLKAIHLCHSLDIAVPGLPTGQISASVREESDPLKALTEEFHTNEDRKQFDWKEKADYVKRIHEAYLAEHGDEWDVKWTASVLSMGETTVYQYLQLTEDPSLMEDEKVADSKSFRAAYKQTQIIKEKNKRKAAVEYTEKRKAERIERGEAPDPLEQATKIVKHADLKDWLPKLPDESMDWFHWDPVYGGEQGGGAFTHHQKIDDSWDVALDLHRFAIPEIYRVLKDGRWLAIWCHPTRITWLSSFLQGHSRDGDHCRHCEREWDTGSLTNPCAGGEWAFWVNPYPNVWYKPNRVADGHEIKRFLTNSYETFLFAAKVEQESDPILMRNDRQNVFSFPLPPRTERRHVMQKPVPLLKEILSCISIHGEFGGDCSVGSGTILEAAYGSGRVCFGCEIDEDFWTGAVHALSDVLSGKVEITKEERKAVLDKKIDHHHPACQCGECPQL